MYLPLKIGLVLHILGLSTLVGVNLVKYFLTRKFRIHYKQDKKSGLAILQATSNLRTVAIIGLLLLILSGVMMLGATRGIYGQQFWFKTKMIFVILIIVASIFLNRVLENRLSGHVINDMEHGNKTIEIQSLVSRITYVQVLLLLFFLAIFILSIFRFT
ncbi:MAG TPA: hypothetical protein VIT44_02440 [Cyclobacteriaceae bacterium]